MNNSSSKNFFLNKGSVEGCESRLDKGFHPYNSKLNQTFLILYRLADLNDSSFASLIGVDRTTANRYRRGVWIPNYETKLKIARKLSLAIGQHVDTAGIWGVEELNLEEKEDDKSD